MEYPSPADRDDRTALGRSASEACQYLQELATQPGVYSCNFLCPGMELFAHSMKTPVLKCAPSTLKRPVTSSIGTAAGKPVGQVLPPLRQLEIIRRKKETEPEAFQTQQLTLAREHLAALFGEAKAAQVVSSLALSGSSLRAQLSGGVGRAFPVAKGSLQHSPA